MTDEQINMAIAKACGWTDISSDGVVGKAPGETCNRVMFCPLYCTDLNAMHAAEMTLKIGYCKEYKDNLYDAALELEKKTGRWMPYSLPARQRAETFLLTLGKWSATNKESLAVQSTSSGGSGGASTYGGNGLGIAGAVWPPETRITVNGKTFCLADIDKEMTE